MRTIKRRRREYKTDYGKRFELLKGGIPRLVFRKTNKNLTVQYVESKEAQDKILFGISSSALMNYGWPKEAQSGLKNTSAAYLLGLLTGKTISEKKLEKPIVDFGMIRVLHKSKLYAFLKGLIDSGMEVQCDEEYFPDESRIKGDHLKNKIPFDQIKSKVEAK